MSTEPTTLTDVLDAHHWYESTNRCICGERPVGKDMNQHRADKVLAFLATHFQKPEVVEAVGVMVGRTAKRQTETFGQYDRRVGRVALNAALETLRGES